jgi:hypothetical protein
MIVITIGLSSNKWFDSLKECAAFLNINNASKKAIEARCRKLHYKVEFN